MIERKNVRLALVAVRSNVTVEMLVTWAHRVQNYQLRLETAKGPVETLVIDSVQRPQEN